MVSFAIDQASLSEGLRAASAATAMLMLGKLLGEPQFSWAAIGAFWTCLADAAGSPRRRLASMLGFAALSALSGGTTAWASGASVFAATATILVFATAAGFSVIWGAATSQVAILAATACVVMVDKPVTNFHDAIGFLGLYLAGCLWAALLGLVVWRIHPLSPARFALRVAWSRLADLAHDLAGLLRQQALAESEWAHHNTAFRSCAREGMESARQALFSVPASYAQSRHEFERLVILLADAEQSFACMIAISDAFEHDFPAAFLRRRAVRCLDAVAVVFRRLGEVAAGESSLPPDKLLIHLRALSRPFAVALGTSVCLKFPLPEGVRTLHGEPQRPCSKTERGVSSHPLRTLRINLSTSSPGFRHAVRVGLATTAAFSIVRAIHVPFGHWATMATLLILQPSVASTWPRSIERVAGSIAGGALAAIIGLGVRTPLEISFIVFPLVCATMSFRRVSYSLFVLFLTPAFVLVADFASPSDDALYAALRLGNNVLGAFIALVATRLLWPHREAVTLNVVLADAVRANLAYLASSLAGGVHDDADLEALRRAAGLASNRAEDVCRLSNFERLKTRNVSTIEVFGLLRRIAGTATRLRLAPLHTDRRDRLAKWVLAVSLAVQVSLRGGSALELVLSPDSAGCTSIELDAIDQMERLQFIADVPLVEAS